MSGGGPRYELHEGSPAPDDLLLEPRKERIERVLENRTRNLVVVLDRLEDTFNMAAVLRTCEAMGVQEVHVVKNKDVPWAPNAKVTQGCDKWLELFRYDDFTECHRALKARGFAIQVSAIRDGAKSLFELSFAQKVAMVFGNERFGVSDEVLSLADGVFWLPMFGFTQSSTFPQRRAPASRARLRGEWNIWAATAICQTTNAARCASVSSSCRSSSGAASTERR